MKFTLNKPFETDQSVVVIDGGLPPGSYHFQLVVKNRSGHFSKPNEVVVNIQRPTLIPPIGIGHLPVTPVVTAPSAPSITEVAAASIVHPPLTPRRRGRPQK